MVAVAMIGVVGVAKGRTLAALLNVVNALR